MASAELQQQVLAQFIESAADYGLRTRNSQWIEASFLAIESTRASNLRDNPASIEAWRRRLPPPFFGNLAALHAEQDRLRRADLRTSPELERLELELTAMEAEAGIGLRRERNLENFRGESSLIQYHHVLGDSAALFTLELGEKQSFLWAVTRRSMNLYRLPPKQQILSAAKKFREKLEAGQQEAHDVGKELYRMLFSELEPQDAGKTDWLIAPPAELLQVPFAALVVDGPKGSSSRYLVELHSLTVSTAPLTVVGPSKSDIWHASWPSATPSTTPPTLAGTLPRLGSPGPLTRRADN